MCGRRGFADDTMLAFTVAVHLDSEILLVVVVLAWRMRLVEERPRRRKFIRKK